MCCAEDNYNYICHTCAEKFSDSNLNQAVIDQISTPFFILASCEPLKTEGVCSISHWNRVKSTLRTTF